MKQPKTALFDFDGVVVDTEPIYDLFWNDAAKRYGLGIDNFADIIKGTTLPYILEKYFSGYTEEFRQMVTKNLQSMRDDALLHARLHRVHPYAEGARRTDRLGYQLG